MRFLGRVVLKTYPRTLGFTLKSINKILTDSVQDPPIQSWKYLEAFDKQDFSVAAQQFPGWLVEGN